MKELLDIISLFSEERKENNKAIQVLKIENKKLKHYKAICERDVNNRNRFGKYNTRDIDNDLIDKIVNQEVAKFKKAYAKEKENLISQWNQEAKMRDHHIELLSESVQSQEIENKHLLDIIYTKDKEIEDSHKHLESIILSLRKENKRLKCKQQNYD